MRALLALLAGLLLAASPVDAAPVGSDSDAPVIVTATPKAAASSAPISFVDRPLIDQCAAETCKARMTADQLLAEVQLLVLAKRYDEARPMLDALGNVPSLRFETRFLTAYIAQQTGDLKGAERGYRAILADDPGQTRVRLELARTLLAMGKLQSADHHFRVAAQSEDLPPDIARTIRGVRNIIRSKRPWRLNVDFGVAPDTNINNATGLDTVTVLFGTQPIPLTLSQSAQAQSGVGITASIDAGLRMPVADKLLLIADVDLFGTEYRGSDFDDQSLEFAGGAEVELDDRLSLRAQAVAAQRNFGGRIASRQIGVKGGAEFSLGRADRIGIQFDVRNTDARFDANFDGWQMGAYATWEHVIGKALVASASLFARRDSLRAGAYSNTELGAIIGIGGELPKGFEIGVSGGASRAAFDDPLPLFSPDPRRDWRYNARLTLGNRKLAVWGFSPTLSVSYGRNDSTISYFTTERARVRMAVTRYF